MTNPEHDSIAIRARIHGRVQGVGYRDWTMRRAAALGLRGWVRNRRDGSVEVLLIGRRGAVERMLADCRLGPSLARVDSLDAQPAEPEAVDGFDFRPTV